MPFSVRSERAGPRWWKAALAATLAASLALLAGCTTLVFTVDMPVPGARYRDAREHAYAVLDEVGLAGMGERDTGGLSGGELQRLGIFAERTVGVIEHEELAQRRNVSR